MVKGLQIKVQEDIDTDLYRVTILAKDEEGRKKIARLVWEDVKEWPTPNEATLTVDAQAPEVLQALVNRLYDMRIRPAAAAGSAGQLDAVNANCADLRSVINQLMPIVAMAANPPKIVHGGGQVVELEPGQVAVVPRMVE